jgi:hypothetical protein
MGLLEDKGNLRKMLVPAAAGVVGAGTGLFLTRKQRFRDTMPDFTELGISDLAEDLRGKLDSVLGKVDISSRAEGSSSSTGNGHIDSQELARRRRDREQRRNRRQART